MERALHWLQFVFGSSTKAPVRLRLHFVPSPAWAVQAARGLGALSPGVARLFPPRPQRAPPVGSQEVFRQEPGACLQCGRGGFSGAEFAPFPYPLPPTSSGDGPALFWSFSVPLFCEPPAVCSGWLIFPLLSQQFKKAPSDCSQGLPAGPYPKECRRLLSAPPPPAGGWCGRLVYFSAGSCF